MMKIIRHLFINWLKIEEDYKNRCLSLCPDYSGEDLDRIQTDFDYRCSDYHLEAIRLADLHTDMFRGYTGFKNDLLQLSKKINYYIERISKDIEITEDLKTRIKEVLNDVESGKFKERWREHKDKNQDCLAYLKENFGMEL